MKERPILFNAPMVRAILDRSKTQTRRAVRDRYIDFIGGSDDDHDDPGNWGFSDENGNWHVLDQEEKPFFGSTGFHETYRITCPYGEPGDRLWVREEHYRFGHWEPVEGKRTKGGRQKWRFVPDAGGCGPYSILGETLFESPAAGEFRVSRNPRDPKTPAWHKRLARFMPRKLSRLTLEIVSVRVERLQDISEEDAIVEGIERGKDFFGCPMWRDYGSPEDEKSWCADDPVTSYRTLWGHINGACSWDANPWVWVVEFRKVEEVSRG